MLKIVVLILSFKSLLASQGILVIFSESDTISNSNKVQFTEVILKETGLPVKSCDTKSDSICRNIWGYWQHEDEKSFRKTINACRVYYSVDYIILSKIVLLDIKTSFYTIMIRLKDPILLKENWLDLPGSSDDAYNPAARIIALWFRSYLL